MMRGSAGRGVLIAPVKAGSAMSGGALTRGDDQMNGVHDAMPTASALAKEEVQESEEKEDLIFAVFAENAEQLDHAILLAESIRTFAGHYRNNPILIFMPPEGIDPSADLGARLIKQGVELHESTAPDETLWFYYARKVFAAAQAESLAEGRGERLAWLDEDTIVLQEPKDFTLGPELMLAYRPVTHRNIGSLYSKTVDDLWARVYRILAVPDSALFPMITPADGDTIRPYFNAGLLVVRPERGILRRWAEDFTLLATDSRLMTWCRQDVPKRIFLHQAALVGAILNLVSREEMLELPPQYNYPLSSRRCMGPARPSMTSIRWSPCAMMSISAIRLRIGGKN